MTYDMGAALDRAPKAGVAGAYTRLFLLQSEPIMRRAQAIAFSLSGTMVSSVM